jgi:hypothetical protein
MQQLGIAAGEPWVLLCLAATGVTAGVLLWRWIAHRFEFEADVLSAEALGGAAPCVTALQRVGELHEANVDRSTMRHPSESARVATLRRWEVDPGFRGQFHAVGRRLRFCIAGAVMAALGFSSWAWWAAWPVEHAVYAFYTGDFATAKAQIEAANGLVRADQWPWWQKFRANADAAFAVDAVGGEWEHVCERLASAGWNRGVEVLRTDGPAAARPWFALAAERADPSPLRLCLYRYCDAVHDGDAEGAERLRRWITGLDLPDELRAVFAN